jgi:hypothetical protein
MAKLYKTMLDKHEQPYTVHRDVGKRYARLRLLEVKRDSGLFVCDCGNLCTLRLSNVRSGHTKACTLNGSSAHDRAWINEPVETPDMTIDEINALRNRS